MSTEGDLALRDIVQCLKDIKEELNGIRQEIIKTEEAIRDCAL